MKVLYKHILTIAALIVVFSSCEKKGKLDKRILVFSKTIDFRHESIEDGKEMFLKLGRENGFKVDTTENSIFFVDDSLKNYSAIVFLNTTGNILDFAQQSAFQRYIEAGGGFMGVHGASGAEYSWPWYGELVGARFESHPEKLQKGEVHLAERDHPANEGLPFPWIVEEEWYNFQSISPNISVLATVNESSYQGGKHGDNHPVSWYQEFSGGRSFYTALGHRPEIYADSLFMKHIANGIKYLTEGNTSIDYALAKTLPAPREGHLMKTVLLDSVNVSEPMELGTSDDGRIFYIERKGKVQVYDPKTDTSKIIGAIPVYHDFEDGLLGLTLDPDFNSNQWLYVFYSAPQEAYSYHISRFKLNDLGMLDFDSERIILKVHEEYSESNHTGGSLAFDQDGNLYIAIGDNTNPFGDSHGYAPIDEREGRIDYDAQRSSGNTNDLRGKILRIHPENDGTYSIPDGNLFPKDGSGGKPEIYVMGTRNSFRISIDPETSWLYWGDVGPDAGKDSIQGPQGYDEINQARKAGNYGWPYFIGSNKAYHKVDFSTGVVGEKFDVNAPINTSHRNTGARILPPSEPAFIYYPYVKSARFPLLGEGGRTAMAGPVYHYDPDLESNTKLPAYYDKCIFIYDWMRNWIMVVRTDENGNYIGMEPFMPNTSFDKIIDMELGPDGALYILEYGTNWYSANKGASLSKLHFSNNTKSINSGNRFALKESSKGHQTSKSIITDTILSKSDCMACHARDTKSVGPSYFDIATKYPLDSSTVNKLANKIISGGAGVWGQSPMSAHPQLSKEEAREMVEYILRIKEKSQSIN